MLTSKTRFEQKETKATKNETQAKRKSGTNKITLTPLAVPA